MNHCALALKDTGRAELYKITLESTKIYEK